MRRMCKKFPESYISHLSPRCLHNLYLQYLYPQEDCTKSHGYFFDKYPDPGTSTDTIIKLAQLVLTLSSFEFNGGYFDRITGVAMETKMGRGYSCLFMGYLKAQIWEICTDGLLEFYR